MAIGPIVRRIFGPYEKQVASAYRGIFINLDDLASTIYQWSPRPTNILEVGCGEGAMTEFLVRTFPAVPVVALDPSPKIGRLYQGDRKNVAFFQGELTSYIILQKQQFELIILSDVLHH